MQATPYGRAMKVSLKSIGLDLELDNVEKLEDVLNFIQRFKEIELTPSRNEARYRS